MNIVSIETVRELRNAGFPQPETVEDGQFWYSCGKDPFYISSELRTGIKPEKWFNCYPAFAPTATDVLRELPDYAIVFDASQAPAGFTCYDTLRRVAEQYPVTHEHPAEAAALAWLQLNVK